MSTGEVVHFVLENGPDYGQCRPAIVVKAAKEKTEFSTLYVIAHEGGAWNPTEKEYYKASAYGAEAKPGTWHPIEACPDR